MTAFPGGDVRWPIALRCWKRQPSLRKRQPGVRRTPIRRWHRTLTQRPPSAETRKTRQAANIAAAARREKTAKARARRQVDSRAAAEKQKIAQRAQTTIERAEQPKAAEQNRIAKRQRQATAAPKQQLSDANSKKRDAAGKRAEAKRLNTLAVRERQQRQTSKVRADRLTPHP